MPLNQSTRLVSEIATAVKRQFGDESGTQINDTDIIRWVNQGQEYIVISEQINRNSISTTSVAGQAQYNFPSQSIIEIFAIMYNNVPLQHITFQEAQLTIIATAESTSYKAIPTMWYEWGDSIFFYPTPQANGDTIKVFLSSRPGQVVSTTDTITIPDTYYNALVSYVLSQAYELDDDFDKAQFKLGQLADNLSSLEPNASSRFYSTITVLPGDM